MRTGIGTNFEKKRLSSKDSGGIRRLAEYGRSNPQPPTFQGRFQAWVV